MREQKATLARLSAVAYPDKILVSTIVLGEVLYGLRRLSAGRKLIHFEQRVRQILSEVECQPVPAEAAEFYAEYKTACEAKGCRLDDSDLWIAATAKAMSAVLVTRDSDFARIPDFGVVDWSQ